MLLMWVAAWSVVCGCVCAGNADKMLLLVNRQRVAPSQSYVQYWFAPGDAVEVACLSTDVGRCKPQLQYYHEDQQLLDFDTEKKMEVTAAHLSPAGVSMRARLRAALDGAHVHCTCTYAEDNLHPAAQFTLTFVLQDVNKDVWGVRMNGLVLRPVGRSHTNEYSVHYREGERFRFVCDYDHDVECKGEETLLSTRQQIARPTNSEVTPNSALHLKYEAYHKSAVARTSRTEHISFKKIDYAVNMLSLNLPEDNIILELYAWNEHQRIYYEFAAGDQLALNCSYVAPGLTAGEPDGYRLSFDNSNTTKRSITQYYKLSAAHDKKEVNCSLWSNNNHNVSIQNKFITVIFCFKTTTTGNVGFTVGALVGLGASCVVGGALGSLLVGWLAARLVAWIRRRREAREREARARADERARRRAAQRPQLPLPAEATAPEPTYAVLDISRPNKPEQNKNRTKSGPRIRLGEDPPYAQVVVVGAART